MEIESVSASSRHSRRSVLMVRELRKLLSSVLHGVVTLKRKISGFCSKLAQAIRERIKEYFSYMVPLPGRHMLMLARKRGVGSPTRGDCSVFKHSAGP